MIQRRVSDSKLHVDKTVIENDGFSLILELMCLKMDARVLKYMRRIINTKQII